MIKRLFQVVFYTFVITYFLFLKKGAGDSVALAILGMTFLDRLAAWCDRKVPDSDPRKHF
jgi:hypothetical protein